MLVADVLGRVDAFEAIARLQLGEDHLVAFADRSRIEFKLPRIIRSAPVVLPGRILFNVVERIQKS